MARNTRKFPKDDEDQLRDTLQKLRSQLRKLRKENRELRSENVTLLEAWSKTEAYLKDVTDTVSLEELLKYKVLPKHIIQNKTEKSVKTKETKLDEAKDKLNEWRKENL